MLTQAKGKPEITRYLTYIYSNGPLVPKLGFSGSQLTLLRSSAALNLKNVIKTAYKYLDEDERDFIRSRVLSCLNDSDAQVRTLSGTVITEIVQKGGILGWPDIFGELLCIADNNGQSSSSAAQTASMNALAKICEDKKGDLGRDYQGHNPLEFLVPRLLQIIASPNAQVRALAITCISTLIPYQSSILLDSMDAVLERLFRLVNDESPEVRQNLCRAFVLIVEIGPEKIVPHMQGLVNYMCLQQRDKDEPDSALEAAEFWLAVSENDKIYPSLEPYLRTIVPVLLESMVYDEESIIRFSGAAEDAAVEDQAEDIKPRFAAPKSPRTFTNGRATEDMEDGEINDEDDADDGDVDEQWNLRKCSAAALDVLASKFQRLVFDIALEYLDKNLTNSEWPYRESAVLAMGAIAEGCMDAVAPALPNIVPYLTSLLNDSEPSVRLITCWALGRYSAWALSLQDPVDRRRYFDSILNGILNRMLDKVKKVQTAAASALASISEKAGKDLAPYSLPIVRTFSACFEFYKARNIYVLYDCVQTLADQVGGGLRDPVLINLLMPAMIKRWQKLTDQSQELFPLHECLSYITAALGESFAPFAVPIFNRCIGIIRHNLEQVHLAEGDDLLDKPDKDFLVTSLDLLSAIIQALDPAQSGELVQTSQPRFFDLLIYCMRDSNNDVKQSAYALLGDCAMNIYAQLHPFLPSLIPEAMQQLDMNNITEKKTDTMFSVVNNVCWSLGEIAMKYKQEMTIYTDALYRKLKTIVDQPSIPMSVAENAAITIGRLGLHSTDIIIPHLGDFVGRFLQVVALVELTEEKSQAFLGLNRMISKNPYAIGSYLLQYLQASLVYSKESSSPIDQGETIGSLFNQVRNSQIFLCLYACGGAN